MKIFKTSNFVGVLAVVLFAVGNSVALAADITITSVSPTSAKVGDTVTITGTNFPASSFIHIISPGMTPMDVKPTSVTPSSATFIVPFGWATVGDVSITIGPDPAWISPGTGGTTPYPTSNAFPLAIQKTTPIITGVSPTTAKVGDTVTVTGTGFNYAQDIEAFYGPSHYSVSVGAAMISPTSATFKIPWGIKGPITVFFSTPTAIPSPASNEIAMTVLPIAPTLISIFDSTNQPQKVRKGVRAVFPISTSALGTSAELDKEAALSIDNNPAYTFPISHGDCSGNYTWQATCVLIPSEISAGFHSFQIKETDSGLMSNSVQVEIVDNPIISSGFAPYWSYTTSYGGLSSSVLHLIAALNGTGFDTKTLVYLDGTSIVPTSYCRDVSCGLTLPNTLVPGSTHTLQVKQSDSSAVSNIVSFTVPQKTVTATPTPTPAPIAPTQTQTNDNTSPQALQQQLVQLITLLLQLVQKAATQGLLTSDQVTSILGSIQIPQ